MSSEARGVAWTPEPWSIEQSPICGNRILIERIVDMGIKPIEVTTVCTLDDRNDSIDMELCEANASRIVACVNACAGIPTPDLQSLASLREEVRRLREALESIFVWAALSKPDHNVNYLSFINWFNNMNTAQNVLGSCRDWREAFGKEMAIAERLAASDEHQ